MYVAEIQIYFRLMYQYWYVVTIFQTQQISVLAQSTEPSDYCANNQCGQRRRENNLRNVSCHLHDTSSCQTVRDMRRSTCHELSFHTLLHLFQLNMPVAVHVLAGHYRRSLVNITKFALPCSTTHHKHAQS